MEPITKAQPAEDVVIKKEENPSDPFAKMTLQLEGIPVDVIRYFGVDLNKMDRHMQGQLRDIVNCITPDRSMPMTDVMRHLRDLDIKLGQHGFGETRHSRIWSYLKVGRNIQQGGIK